MATCRGPPNTGVYPVFPLHGALGDQRLLCVRIRTSSHSELEKSGSLEGAPQASAEFRLPLREGPAPESLRKKGFIRGSSILVGGRGAGGGHCRPRARWAERSHHRGSITVAAPRRGHSSGHRCRNRGPLWRWRRGGQLGADPERPHPWGEPPLVVSAPSGGRSCFCLYRRPFTAGGAGCHLLGTRHTHTPAWKCPSVGLHLSQEDGWIPSPCPRHVAQ